MWRYLVRGEYDVFDFRFHLFLCIFPKFHDQCLRKETSVGDCSVNLLLVIFTESRLIVTNYARPEMTRFKPCELLIIVCVRQHLEREFS